MSSSLKSAKIKSLVNFGRFFSRLIIDQSLNALAVMHKAERVVQTVNTYEGSIEASRNSM